VLHALKSGYRLIDCAYCYGNEEEVGQGLAEAFASGVCKREDVFVVSKVWATYTTRCELGLDKSLEKLGLGWVDLFLVVCSFFSFSLALFGSVVGGWGEVGGGLTQRWAYGR
jgi:diketogulonate reductase-like aldo/keto reductase